MRRVQPCADLVSASETRATTCIIPSGYNPFPSPHGSHLTQLDLDDYDTIRLINYIRREVAAGVNPLAVLQAEAQKGPGSGPHPWSSDNYLAPFLEDDPLLGYDYDEHAADEGWVLPRGTDQLNVFRPPIVACSCSVGGSACTMHMAGSWTNSLHTC